MTLRQSQKSLKNPSNSLDLIAQFLSTSMVINMNLADSWEGRDALFTFLATKGLE